MNIFIVGGGFAGINAAKELSKKLASYHKIYLINSQEYTTMLPNLPEIVSSRFEKKDITENITNITPSRVKFLKEKITSLNFDEKKIYTIDNEYDYDYLVLATGSKTNFFNFNQNLDKVNVLESLECAQSIKRNFTEYLEDRQIVNLVISGAGFTGIELACNLYDICKKRGKKINVTMVEVAKKILPMVSQKSRSHICGKLHKLEFNINTSNQVKTFDGKNITLSSGEVISDVFFCWCSGVMASLKPTGCYDALPDGRILVDEFLSIPNYPEVFVVGDAAAIKDKNKNILRRAVTFAQMSGKNAGKNIAQRIEDNEGEVFNPIDLGWIIPMYITSVGVVLGVQVRGHKGIFMHYIMCGVLNYNFRNFCTEVLAAIKYTFV